MHWLLKLSIAEKHTQQTSVFGVFFPSNLFISNASKIPKRFLISNQPFPLRLRGSLISLFICQINLQIDQYICIQLIYLHIILADCGNPPLVERSSISVGNNLEGTTRYYTCMEKTVAQGLSSTTCQIDGTWSITNLYCRRKLYSQSLLNHPMH